MSKIEDMSIESRLMLLQGIDQIQSGLKFIDWVDGMMPNQLSDDALLILKDRFEYFRECVLSDVDCNFFTLDKIKNNISNIQYDIDYESTISKFDKMLDDLRKTNNVIKLQGKAIETV